MKHCLLILPLLFACSGTPPKVPSVADFNALKKAIESSQTEAHALAGQSEKLYDEAKGLFAGKACDRGFAAADTARQTAETATAVATLAEQGCAFLPVLSGYVPEVADFELEVCPVVLEFKALAQEKGALVATLLDEATSVFGCSR